MINGALLLIKITKGVTEISVTTVKTIGSINEGNFTPMKYFNLS
jgi:hypothetical protein